MASTSTADPLRAFLWGKRSAIRHPLALDVEVRGSQTPLRGISLDLSSGGVLLRFPVEVLQPGAAAGADIDPFVLAETHFRGACVARFRRHRLKVHLELVRLDYRPDDRQYCYVGFRFARPLMEKQLRKLGLDPACCGAEAHGLPSQLVDLRAADDPVVCRIYNGGDDVHPMFEGTVLGLAKRALCLRLEDGKLALVDKRLRRVRVRVEVLEGDQPIWDSHARLQAIGLLEDDPEALELGLVLEEAPSRALRQRFRPPWAA
ncbi:MAG: PilZ domain-containing protein [Planctomycetota bacterium]|nr:PilZ domain-containing protein [Planctomycetota bacterium]